MMNLGHRRWLAALVLSLATAGSVWAVDDPAQGEHGRLTQVPLGEQASGWTVRVIRLQYTNAEELAAVIAGALPPGLHVVPYAPTNSLVIYGRPHRR
jgi:type II secretory pathway component GspD/PulD (secretin)